MLTQVDSDGYSITMMEGIIDYKKDDAVASRKVICMLSLNEVKRECVRRPKAGNSLLNGLTAQNLGLL